MEEKEFSVEEAFDEMAKIINRLEAEDTKLKESMELYQKGVVLLKKCQESLDGVEKEIQILSEDSYK